MIQSDDLDCLFLQHFLICLYFSSDSKIAIMIKFEQLSFHLLMLKFARIFKQILVKIKK